MAWKIAVAVLLVPLTSCVRDNCGNRCPSPCQSLVPAGPRADLLTAPGAERLARLEAGDSSSLLAVHPVAEVNESLLRDASAAPSGLASLDVRVFETEYPGPNSPNYADLHATAREFFAKADKVYWTNTKGKQLQIESGLRTVYKQADLYICWRLGQSGCNPADIPGVSVHNYGLAIDIRNAADANVVAALDGNGWDRTVSSEPWHWEPVGTPAHTAAAKKREEMRADGSLARRWQAEWEAAKTKNDRRNSKIGELKSRYAAWEPSYNQFKADADAYNRDVDAFNAKIENWKADVESVNGRVDRYNAEIDSLKALAVQINGMSPSPERDRLIAEYNQRAQAADSERQAIQNAQASLEQRKQALLQEKTRLSDRRVALDARGSALKAEYDALVVLKGEIDALEVQIKKHMTSQKALLDELAKVVQP